MLYSPIEPPERKWDIYSLESEKQVDAFYNQFRSALHWVGEFQEISDVRERQESWMTTRTFLVQLRIRQEQVLYANLPPLSDHEKWIDRSTAIELRILANEKWQDELKILWCLDEFRRNDCEKLIGECEYLRKMLNHLKVAKSQNSFVYQRREALRDLRDLMTPVMYDTGAQIPFGPYWRMPCR